MPVFQGVHTEDADRTPEPNKTKQRLRCGLLTLSMICASRPGRWVRVSVPTTAPCGHHFFPLPCWTSTAGVAEGIKKIKASPRLFLGQQNHLSSILALHQHTNATNSTPFPAPLSQEFLHYNWNQPRSVARLTPPPPPVVYTRACQKSPNSQLLHPLKEYFPLPPDSKTNTPISSSCF